MFVKGQSNCDNFYWFWLRYCKQEHWAFAKEKLNKSIFNIITGGANYRVGLSHRDTAVADAAANSR